MPLVSTDAVYELKVRAQQGGRNMFNILHYVNDGLSPDNPGSTVLVDNFISQVLPDWRALINSAGSIVEVSARRLGSITDFKDTPVSLPGLVNGDRTPRFVAFRIDKVRATKETRSGSIRISGMTETDTVVQGSSLEAAALTRLTALAGTLANPIISGGNRFAIVLVGNKYDTSVTPKVLKPELDWTFNRIAALAAQANVTSQVSRK